VNLDNAGLNRQLKQLQSTLLLDLLPLPPAAAMAEEKMDDELELENADYVPTISHDHELPPGLPTPFEPRDGFERRFQNVKTRDAKAKGQARGQDREGADEKEDDVDSLASNSSPSIRRGEGALS
jgi:hypothetical protein